jgi:heme-degrading monooxygenase HmoA
LTPGRLRATLSPAARPDGVPASRARPALEGKAMYARVTRIKATGDADDAIRVIQEQVVPWVRGAEGSRGGYWLLDRGANLAIAITLWESEEAMAASEESAAKVREESAQAVGGSEMTVERYEVIAHV